MAKKPPMKRELTLDSRDVANMVEKNHKELLRDIRNYIDQMDEANFEIQDPSAKLRSADFFIENKYLDGNGQERPKYDVTKKGCEFIANKLTGTKGTLFTATYINKFHQMEQALIAIHDGEPVAIKKEEQEKLFIQKQRAEAMLLNARTRQAKLILEIQKMGNLSPVSVELLNLNAVETLTGKALPYRPAIEKTYSATDIARELGVSANKVGRVANANNLKTAEFGIEVIDKSRHNDKQMPNFRYNAKGRERLIELLESEYAGITFPEN